MSFINPLEKQCDIIAHQAYIASWAHIATLFEKIFSNKNKSVKFKNLI